MMTRLAAVQLATTTNVDANLATCLRLLDEAAGHKPDLAVLPEFCNRLSWYADKAEAYTCAVEENGAFLEAIAGRARKHAMHVVVNVTVRRAYPRITITSFLFGPDGQKLAHADKQTLMGRENLFFDRAEEISPVIPLPFGKIGLFMCRDGVTMETPRGLALRGAQVLVNSLNSFAFDEAALHIPVRAPENKVFVVSANKVGPLIPIEILHDAAEKLGVPADLLYGAGESQIVAPDGTVLAKAPLREEAVIFADIDPAQAEDKRRPDGTDIYAARRPGLYSDITSVPEAPQQPAAAEKIMAATYQPAAGEPREVLLEAVREASVQQVSMLVLPELAGISDPRDPLESETLLESLVEAVGDTDLVVCTSLGRPNDLGSRTLTGVAVGKEGLLLEQPQLHATASNPWSVPGDRFQFADLPWGRLGILVGDDSIYPETAKILAIRGADVLAVPFDAREKWELALGLADRSAENRVCIVAATRPKSFGGSLIITQWKDFQIFTPWTQREFSGTINDPIVRRAPQDAGLFCAEVHPETARFKTMSYETDLIQGRPWFLADPLIQS